MPNKRRQLLQVPIQLSLFDPVPLPLLAPDPLVTSALPASSPSLSPAAPEGVATPLPKRRVLAGQHLIEYRLRRSKRRSIGLVIEDEGLRITAPRWVTIAEIEATIQEKQRWIITKLDELRTRLAQRKVPEPWRDGAAIDWLGKAHTLRVQENAPTATVTLDPHTETLTITLRAHPRPDALKTVLERWLQQEVRRVFSERLSHFAEKIGVTYRSFALSGATTQWGSCTASGALRLNWRLIHLPLYLIDYVVVHELCHLREMNHSARFWNTVQSVFPDYQAAEQALKHYSPGTLSQP